MKIKNPNRHHKIKDKHSSGCGLCKPHKHGGTSKQVRGKPKEDIYSELNKE